MFVAEHARADLDQLDNADTHEIVESRHPLAEHVHAHAGGKQACCASSDSIRSLRQVWLKRGQTNVIRRYGSRGTQRFDYCIRTRGDGKVIMGLCAGVGIDYHADWAGGVNDLWWNGVIIKNNVEDGRYDLTMVSMEQLRKEYA